MSKDKSLLINFMPTTKEKRRQKIKLMPPTVLLFISILSQTNAVTDSRCQQIIDVNDDEFGIVYEYFNRGNNVVCSYEFYGEDQQIMLAVSHIGLFARTAHECTTQLTITDLTIDGDEITSSVICNEDDIKKKGGFVSTGNSAKVTFNGHSDSGILLLHYWFVKQVVLIDRDVDEVLESVSSVNTPDSTSEGCFERIAEFQQAGIDVQCHWNGLFRPLQCSHWGADINLNRCVCVDETGKINDLKPPYCLQPPESFETRCLQDLARARLTLALQEIRELIVPSCDENGNFKTLQCGYVSEMCKCVDPFTGDATYLTPPLCELPTTTEKPLSTTAVTPNFNSSSCIVFFCTLMCKSGIYAKNEDGCPICACEPYEEVTIKKCPEVSSQMINETLEQWNLNEAPQSYSWIPECSLELYSPKQSNHIAGHFCVDQLTGQPSGKEPLSCVSYKSCVTERIKGFSKALRIAGYKKTSKEVKRLISSDNNANDVSRVWNLMNEEERSNILTKSSIFIPSCNAYGDFNLLQCNTATGWCWCVDMFGDQIEESRRTVTQPFPDCTQYVRHQVPVPIDDGSDVVFREGDSWSIFETFDNFNISDNIYYFWTKNNAPVPLIFDDKYSVGTWIDEGKLTITLYVNNGSNEDAGIYRCNIIKSPEMFVSSKGVKSKFFSTAFCGSIKCDKVCFYGYKHEPCTSCECWSKPGTDNYWETELMRINIATTFGRIDGRCKAKRQWIMRELKSRDVSTNLDVSRNIDIPPECDSNGNFKKLQMYEHIGRVCVDVMTGQPNGRMLPDCSERSQCVKVQLLGMESRLKQLLNDKRDVESIIGIISEQESLQQQYTLYYESLTYAPDYVIINENVSDLLPVGMCDRLTGLFNGEVCNISEFDDCWCIDNFEGSSNKGVNNTEYVYCGDTSVTYNVSKVDIIPVNDTDLRTEINSRVNSIVELQCSITATSPDAYVTWSTPSGFLEHVSIIDKRIKLIGDGITDFTLQIKDVNYDDQGTYYCFLYQYLSGYGDDISYYINIV